MNEQTLVGSANPVEGDPDAVDALVRELRATANSLREYANETGGIGQGEDWKGPAADAFREVQKSIPETLRKLETRYRSTSDALANFARDLRTAKHKAVQAQAGARTAVNDRHEADRQLRWQAEHPPAPGAPPMLGPDWNHKRDDALRSLSTAHRRVAEAIEIRDNAARSCAEAIRRACDDGLQNAGGIFGFLQGFARWSSETFHLETVATVLGIAGAVLGILAILFTGPFALLALGVGLASLLANAALWAANKKDGTDALWDVFGIATFGMGRVVTSFAKSVRGVKALKLLESSKSWKPFALLSRPGGKPIRLPKFHLNELARANSYGSFTLNLQETVSSSALRAEFFEKIRFRMPVPPPEIPGIPYISTTARNLDIVEYGFSGATGSAGAGYNFNPSAQWVRGQMVGDSE